MSNIFENLQKISTARYGKDVRQAIHDAIHDCYEDGKAGVGPDLIARDEIRTTNQNLSNEINARKSKDSVLENSINNEKSERVTKDTELSQQISAESSARMAEIAVERQRIDSFTHLAEGSTTGDAELIDGRIGADGTVYDNIGGAIRGQVSDIKEDINKVKSDYDLVKNTTHEYYNLYSGTLNPNHELYFLSDYIEVKKDKVYKLTCASATLYDASLVVYNTNKVVIAVTQETYNNTEWTATENGFIRIAKENTKPICLSNDIFVNEEISYIKDKLSFLPNPFENKTILWLGTSIPAGTENNNYPKMVGELLNCNVINNAIGSSTIRTGFHERVSESEPMGISYYHYEIATRCLTQSLEEKNDIINNWGTKWGPEGSTFPLYASPQTLQEWEKEVIRQSSYENILIPYLNGTYDMPDIFIFDYGWNDGSYTNDEEMSIIPSNENDRHYFIGAMNLIFTMIKGVNPRAKIYIIGHYENDYKPHVNHAQEKIADIWGFPLCKLWEVSGISNKNISYNGEIKSVRDVYCPDTLHPHSDTSGETNKLIATKIAEWLKTVY